MTLGEDYRAKYQAGRTGAIFTGKLGICEAVSIDGGALLLTVRLLTSALVAPGKLEAMLGAASVGTLATVEIQFLAGDAK